MRTPRGVKSAAGSLLQLPVLPTNFQAVHSRLLLIFDFCYFDPGVNCQSLTGLFGFLLPLQFFYGIFSLLQLLPWFEWPFITRFFIKAKVQLAHYIYHPQSHRLAFSLFLLGLVLSPLKLLRRPYRTIWTRSQVKTANVCIKMEEGTGGWEGSSSGRNERSYASATHVMCLDITKYLLASVQEDLESNRRDRSYLSVFPVTSYQSTFTHGFPSLGRWEGRVGSSHCSRRWSPHGWPQCSRLRKQWTKPGLTPTVLDHSIFLRILPYVFKHREMCSVLILIHIPPTSWEGFGDQFKAETLSVRRKKAQHRPRNFVYRHSKGGSWLFQKSGPSTNTYEVQGFCKFVVPPKTCVFYLELWCQYWSPASSSKCVFRFCHSILNPPKAQNLLLFLVRWRPLSRIWPDHSCVGVFKTEENHHFR